MEPERSGRYMVTSKLFLAPPKPRQNLKKILFTLEVGGEICFCLFVRLCLLHEFLYLYIKTCQVDGCLQVLENQNKLFVLCVYLYMKFVCVNRQLQVVMTCMYIQLLEQKTFSAIKIYVSTPRFNPHNHRFIYAFADLSTNVQISINMQISART